MCKFAFLIMQKLLLIAVIIFPAISSLHAATYLIEDSETIENSGFHFKNPYQLIKPEIVIPVNKEIKEVNPNSAFDKESTSGINEKPNIKEEETSVKNETKQTSQSPDLVKQSTPEIIETPSLTTIKSTNTPNYYGVLESINLSIQKVIQTSDGALNELINDETLEDVVLIIRDLNSNLNQLNVKIEQKISPAIEEILFLQQLYSTAGGNWNQLTNFNNYSQTANNNPSSNNPYTSPKLENIPYEEPEGFLSLLFKIPKYIFNLRSIFIAIVSLFLLSGFLRVLRFALNNIY